MGKLKLKKNIILILLKKYHTNSDGEPVYHLVYEATDGIVTPLESSRGMRQLRDDLTEAINEIENENNRNDMGYV